MTTPDEPPRYQIRGLSLYGFTSSEAFLDFLLPESSMVRPGRLVAINAEKVLTAESDADMGALISEAEFKYPDGISIVRAVRKKYPDVQISRIAGADLWEALMARAGREAVPVFLIGGRPEVLTSTCEKLRQQWNVNIVDAEDGYFPVEQRENIYARIAASGAKIVTIAMGSPRQEILMRDCLERCPDVLYMGVGGTYDVFTGVVRRAPKVWQNLGLEWLYRLLRQPSRLGRQLRLLKFLGYYRRGDL